MWKVSFLGKRAGNTAWKNQTTAPLPLWCRAGMEHQWCKPSQSLWGFPFVFLEEWGRRVGLHAILLSISNNVVSPSLEQLFPVQLSLFLPLPPHRGKRSPDDVWAQLQALLYFPLFCSWDPDRKCTSQIHRNSCFSTDRENWWVLELLIIRVIADMELQRVIWWASWFHLISSLRLM